MDGWSTGVGGGDAPALTIAETRGGGDKGLHLSPVWSSQRGFTEVSNTSKYAG